jgi:TRAP transporter TAXI family solute receptor
VQNDVAQDAHLGRGRFTGAPQQDLRAVASLFPEAVHLVANADGGIASVADLRRKRVNLGAEGSGTRSNALEVLASHGVGTEALASAAALDAADALAALAAGRIDATFVTVHAPARELQRAFALRRLALVPIGPAPALLASGLVPLTLPPRTYSRQDGPVPTVASTALLVTRADVPDAQVDAMLALLFERREGEPTAAVSRTGLATARTGVAIPWHPRAEAFLANRSPAATPPATGPSLPPR